MELSLLSREVIAMSAAVGLSHNMFDGALYLGVCDKIVPGLAMAALSFGHLPAIFVPSGQWPAVCQTKKKVRIRQLYAEGKADRQSAAGSGSRLLPCAGYLYLLRYGQHQPVVVNLWGCSFQAPPSFNPMRRC